MGRRNACILLLLFCAASCIFSASVERTRLDGGFDGVASLSRFDFSYSEGLDDTYLDDVTISLVVQDPGKEVYVWFGHAGLMVQTPQGDVMYDWGVFSFGPSFYTDFLFGRLYYRVTSSWADTAILKGIGEDRTVKVLDIPLDNAAKAATIDFVNLNTRPENRTYLYHYYLDNCATRIRDIIDAETGGGFSAWASSIDTGMSFRDFSTLYMKRSWPVAFTLNYLQGPSIDEDITLYDACFLPDVLIDAVATYFDEEPTTIYQGGERQVGHMHLVGTSLLVGIIIAVLLYSLAHTNRRAYGLLSMFVYLYFTAISSVLLFMMLFTDHDVTWCNENLLMLNPLVVIPLIQSIVIVFRPKTGLGATRAVFRILLTLALASLTLKGLFPTLFIQENLYVYAMILPTYVAMSVFKERDRHV